mgnify:CR=1 FL=1
MEYLSLVKSAKKGDSDSFSKLIKLYEKDLYRVARAIVKNDDDALDCIQDAILRAFKSIKNLSKEEYFKTWLIKILINSCNNFISQRISLDSFENYSADSEISIDRLHIEEALGKLEEFMKIPIILYYFEDMSIREIGKSLKISEGTVKSRLSRARNRLKELLSINERRII